ncbi:MAG: hypothetical protein LBD73_07440 [Deferribacteraceae bacterium]|jgi:hypothetical protein|nr:hypothetical protein [Deferribacteraceae bacterium]
MREDLRKKLEDVLNLFYQNETAAKNGAEALLETAEKECGLSSEEAMSIKYHLGIMQMLLKDYDSAEGCLLSAMEIAQSLDMTGILADITKNLSILYEVRGRLEQE